MEEYQEGNDKGNEVHEDSNKPAPTKDIGERYKEGNEENEDNNKAATTKDIGEEYKEGNEKIEEALKNSDTEDIDSNLGSPLSDGKYYMEPFLVLIVIYYIYHLNQKWKLRWYKVVFI